MMCFCQHPPGPWLGRGNVSGQLSIPKNISNPGDDSRSRSRSQPQQQLGYPSLRNSGLSRDGSMPGAGISEFGPPGGSRPMLDPLVGRCMFTLSNSR